MRIVSVEFEKQLRSHLDAQIAATEDHWKKVQAEANARRAHAYTRHGYQTGWEGQLIRCLTAITPDQGANPTGVYRESLDTVSGGRRRAYAYETAAGLVGGQFATALAQMEARTLCEAELDKWKGKKGLYQGRMYDITKAVIRIRPVAFKLFGFGFSRPSTLTYWETRRAEIVRLIDVFYQRKSRTEANLEQHRGHWSAAWRQIAQQRELRASARRPAPSVMRFAAPALRIADEPAAFNDMSELIAFFGVEPSTQRGATGVFTRGSGGWNLTTLYPSNDAASVELYDWDGYYFSTANTCDPPPPPRAAGGGQQQPRHR